jgi:four helix bundle protein
VNHLHAFDVSIELIRRLREPLARIQAGDGDLASQIRRAASSVPLNLAEGQRRAGRDRLHLFRVAAGSAAEVRAALVVAQAWGYVAEGDIAEGLALVDRLVAMTWRMTH